MKAICIYTGEGVGTKSVRETFLSLERHLNPKQYTIKSVKGLDLLEASWTKNCSLLIFPGGRDIPYHEKLKGKINEIIFHYVSQGGRYMGICAGGYFGSHRVEFEKGGALEVLGERELKFFPGVAIGPAFGRGTFSYTEETGASIVKLHTRFQDPPSFSYFNGGAYFEGAEEMPQVEVLATYAELISNRYKTPAIILCHVGKGAALLSGPHPEFRINDQTQEKTRQTLFLHLLKVLSLDDS